MLKGEAKSQLLGVSNQGGLPVAPPREQLSRNTNPNLITGSQGLSPVI